MADPKPKTPEEVGPDQRRGMWAYFNRGFDRDTGSFSDSRTTALTKDSAVRLDGYGPVFKNKDVPLESKAAYVAGRLAHDVLTDGTRVVWWALNHPLAVTGLFGDEVAIRADLSPNYDVERQAMEARGEAATRAAIDAEFAKREGFSHAGEGSGPPLTLARHAIPALATAAMTQFSGNTNYLNILGGGRTPGFQAVLPSEGDPTQSENPLLELGARYIFGRTGRVLPWEQFTQERPEVSYDDYQNYAAYQFDKGPGGLGLIRGTTRNLEGEPELQMMGFRVPFSAATAAAGSMLGGYLGATQADNVINAQLQERFNLQARGPRRLAGAAIGSVLGAIGGKVTGSLSNDLVIQPILNPGRVAAEAAWQQLSPEEKIAIAKGKGGNKHDQGTQLALTQA
jgi:hypothetical protein